MRIAICFSGHIRNIDETWPNIYENLIRPNNADTFLHTWNVAYNEDNLRRDAIIYGALTDTKKLIDLVKPKRYLVEYWLRSLFNPDLELPNIKEAYERSDKSQHRFKDAIPLMGMFYGIKKVIELKSEYEKIHNFTYDMVVRCRPDIVFEKPIVCTDLLSKEGYLNLPINGIYAQTRNSHEERIIHGMNDQFAFGNSKLMDIYGQTFDHLNDEIHLKHNTYWVPEQCLFTWLDSQGINVHPFKTGHRIKRPAGYELSDEEYGKYKD